MCQTRKSSAACKTCVQSPEDSQKENEVTCQKLSGASFVLGSSAADINCWTCDFLKGCLVNKMFLLGKTEWYICWCHYQNFEKNEYHKMIENMVSKGHTCGHDFRDFTRKAQSGNNQWAQRPDFKLWTSDCYHESVTLPSCFLSHQVRQPGFYLLFVRRKYNSRSECCQSGVEISS